MCPKKGMTILVIVLEQNSIWEIFDIRRNAIQYQNDDSFKHDMNSHFITINN